MGDFRTQKNIRCGGRLPVFESLESRMPLAIDFGDAALPYPTTLSEDGARHEASGATLGASRDTEVDGDHSPGSDADDSSGVPDDEEGVTFTDPIRVGQLGARVTVNVQNAPSGARLDAWIDFDSDGAWGGPLEQIANSVVVNNGDNVIVFDVPSWAADGQTFARFRLSTAGNLGVRGAAVDGEVEDHSPTILPPNAASGLFGGLNTVSTTADSAGSVFAGDMDGDGDMDILSTSFLDHKLSWYENDGNELFTSHVISNSNGSTPGSVILADMEGDGDMDVIAAFTGPLAWSWYENDGVQNFSRHDIITADYGTRAIFAADMDLDGDTDVLSASRGHDTIVWYENDGNQGFADHTISATSEGASSVSAIDIDGDGDMDVLSASNYDNEIAWFENDGNQNFTPRVISNAADFPYSVFAADVDGDGDMDVLSASIFDNTIAWYENDGSQSFTRRAISTSVVRPLSVFAADVDGDGDMDVLSASPARSTSSEAKIAWYENDGSQGFTAHTITAATDGANSVFAADVDGDGDVDVLSASHFDDTIAWYENLNAHPPRIVGVTAGGSGSLHPSYNLPTGSGEQLRTVPVGGVDRFSIAFDQDVSVVSDDFAVSGSNAPSYVISDFVYDADYFTATWTLASPVVVDELLLTLADTVNTSGFALDGNWNNPVSLADPDAADFPSGDGSEGGEFAFRLSVLPGDANRDNQITAADYTIWADNYGTSNATFEQGDFTGDGRLTPADYTIWADNFGIDFTGAASEVESAIGLSQVDSSPLRWDVYLLSEDEAEPILAPPKSRSREALEDRVDETLVRSTPIPDGTLAVGSYKRFDPDEPMLTALARDVLSRRLLR